MITLEETGAIIITKEEFCEKSSISKDNWMFNEEIGEKPRFYMYPYRNVDNPERYFFDNDIDSIREFKYMKRYGEIWMRKFSYIKTPEGKKGEWSLWNTWKQLD